MSLAPLLVLLLCLPQEGWDYSLPRPVPRFKHSVPCRAAALSHDGSILVGLDSEGAIVGWDARTAKRLYVRPVVTKEDVSQRLTCSPDGRYVALSSRYPLYSIVRVLRLATGEEVRRFDRCFSPVFSPDGEILAGTDGNQLRRWAIKSGAELPKLPGGEEELKWTAFSPAGDLVAASDGSSGLVRIWDGSRLRRLLTGSSPATALAFSPDGKTLAVGTHWGIRFRDLAGGDDPPLESHEEYATGPLKFSADGRRMIALSRQRRLLVWDLLSGRPLFAWSAFNTPDGLLEVSDRGDRAIWFDRGGLRLERIPELLGGKEAGHFVRTVAFSINGRAITADDDGGVRDWDPASQKEIKDLPARLPALKFFGRVGRWAVYGAGTDPVQIWDLPAGKKLVTLEALPRIDAVAVSPDASTVALGHADGSLSLWDIPGKKERVRIRADLGPVSAVCWSSDGKTLAWGDRFGVVVIADGVTGRDAIRFRSRSEGGIRGLLFQTDGKTLVAQNDKGACWEYRGDLSGDPVQGSPLAIYASRALDIDRRWVASGFMQRGKTLGIVSEELSPDGAYVITVTDRGDVLIWEAPGDLEATK